MRSIARPSTGVSEDMAALAVTGHDVVIRSARMEPHNRYKIDVRTRTVYLNADLSSRVLAGGLLDAVARLRVELDAQARPALRVIAGGAR